MPLTQWSIPVPVLSLLTTLEHAGHPTYLVGGCVRDLLLGTTPHDFDLTTKAHPQTVMTLFPHAIPTGLAHGTVTIPTALGGVEVTTFRREGGYTDGRHPSTLSFDATLKEDLARRDFTINAMALGLNGQLVDEFGGQQDLSQALIRTVGDPALRLQEDGLRLFRALRFGAQLGFSLTHETAHGVQTHAHLGANISSQRIYPELQKILLSSQPQVMELVLSWGLLNHLFSDATIPPLQVLRALPPAPVPRWREFCRLTHFPITALPVERTLRQAILHPERQAVRELALSGHALQQLGLQGKEIGLVQHAMAQYILYNPEKNTKNQLLQWYRHSWNGATSPVL